MTTLNIDHFKPIPRQTRMNITSHRWLYRCFGPSEEFKQQILYSTWNQTLGKLLPLKMVFNVDFVDWKCDKCTFLIHFEMWRSSVLCMMWWKCCQNCLASVRNRDKIFWDSATQISMTTDWLCWVNEGNRVCWCWYCMCVAILLVGSMYLDVSVVFDMTLTFEPKHRNVTNANFTEFKCSQMIPKKLPQIWTEW